MSKVAVVGAGAMGGLWAGRLASGGHEVTIIDVSDTLVRQVREHGIAIAGPDGTAEAAVRATTDTEEAGAQDVVFIFVKGPHTQSAASNLGPLLGEETAVATLQNGWGNADVLADAVPLEHLVVGVTFQAATITGLGKVAHLGQGPSHLGPYVDGGALAPAYAVADAMTSADFETIVTSEVKTAIWSKLVHNAAALPVSALTDLRTAPLVEPSPWRDLLDGIAREAAAVAQALGYRIDADERIAHIHKVLGAAGMGVPSMLADVHARRQTEIATVNGAVVRHGREAGIEVPLNEAMVALVEGLQRAWRDSADT